MEYNPILEFTVVYSLAYVRFLCEWISTHTTTKVDLSFNHEFIEGVDH